MIFPCFTGNPTFYKPSLYSYIKYVSTANLAVEPSFSVPTWLRRVAVFGNAFLFTSQHLRIKTRK